MSQLADLTLFTALVALAATWLALSRARERAVEEARRACVRHGLQLLDETVGLRALRLRRQGGQRVLERGYAFEVSASGNDRQPGQLWMVGQRLSGLSLPAGPDEPGMATEAVAPAGNVIPLRPRNRTLH